MKLQWLCPIKITEMYWNACRENEMRMGKDDISVNFFRSGGTVLQNLNEEYLLPSSQTIQTELQDVVENGYH